jgi:hypothetical protein
MKYREDMLPKPVRKASKVAICGYSDSNRYTPFGEQDWEIWGLNALYDVLPGRYDRWFEIHTRQVNLGDEGPNHIWKLASFTIPIYMQRHYSDIPTSVPYPLEAVQARFKNYLTSSFSFMAALAIIEGFEEIGVFGVDTPTEEWGSQRPSLEYFLGYAEGQGIKVTIPGESTLMKAPFIYGYQERESNAYLGKILNYERAYLRKRASAQRLAEEGQREVLALGGAIDALRNLRGEWIGPFKDDGAEQSKDSRRNGKDNYLDEMIETNREKGGASG